jgi:peptide chain release factor subunit 3
VDPRTIEKYERESKEKNRESWYLAFIMDTSEEERAKGKTVECGRGQFETETKRYSIIDAPGHKSFVPNMISGASQAEVGVLVISARKGEFETGFEKGGQTREHAMLAKTLGVKNLIIVINKMDDPTVDWSKERYDECKTKLTPFLKQCGYAKADVTFVPVSGLQGHNIKDPVDSVKVPLSSWHDGKTLLGVLDGLKKVDRDSSGPVRMPVTDRFKDGGLNVMGKVRPPSSSSLFALN